MNRFDLLSHITCIIVMFCWLYFTLALILPMSILFMSDAIVFLNSLCIQSSSKQTRLDSMSLNVAPHTHSQQVKLQLYLPTTSVLVVITLELDSCQIRINVSECQC